MKGISWQDVPPTIEERIAQCEKNSNYLEPNCFGTLFFLKGILPYDQDVYTDPDNRFIQRALKHMREIAKPEDDCIVFCESYLGIEHGFYIRTINPFLGYHRAGSCGDFETLENLEPVEKYLKSISGLEFFRKKEWSYSYYKLDDPKKLESWAKDVVKSYRFGGHG